VCDVDQKLDKKSVQSCETHDDYDDNGNRNDKSAVFATALEGIGNVSK
jgi:hypothetical protein